MKKLLTTTCCLIWATAFFAPKKQLTHEDLVAWKQIKSPTISNNGRWVAWSLKAEEGDAALKVWNADTGTTLTFDRGEKPTFSSEGPTPAAPPSIILFMPAGAI